MKGDKYMEYGSIPHEVVAEDLLKARFVDVYGCQHVAAPGAAREADQPKPDRRYAWRVRLFSKRPANQGRKPEKTPQRKTHSRGLTTAAVSLPLP